METFPESLVGLERDLYAAVLRLARAADPEAGLRAVVTAAVQYANAERGYVELYAASSGEERRWSLSVGCTTSEEEEIRAVTSRGIVASAMMAGTTVHTPFASLDERFESLKSVREQRLEAVLCIPLGGREPGVLYLEGKRGQGGFPAEACSLLEEIAAFLVPAAEQLAARQRASVDPTLPFRQRLRLEPIIGRSTAMARVFEHVGMVAPRDVTLLITGESGTGKTQIAHAIHMNSRRKGEPFLEVNCAAIPEGLFESELFGTLPGAFPGARRMDGKVKAAEGGTLFLDEIAEIPLAAQGKLLQLLQSKQYYALAGTQLEKADVRLIAATNVDLELCVAERRFRADLYHRLNILPLRMPSLAERRADIGLMVEELVVRLAEEHGLPPLAASPAFRVHCETASWKGNVRELRHAVEAALIRAAAEQARYLEPRHLGGALAEDEPREGEPRPLTFHEATLMFQRDLLTRELEACGENVSKMAERLGLARSHVYKLMSQFGILRTNRGNTP